MLTVKRQPGARPVHFQEGAVARQRDPGLAQIPSAEGEIGAVRGGGLKKLQQFFRWRKHADAAADQGGNADIAPGFDFQ